MQAAEELPEIHPFDKVPEAKMAEILGTTARALESKRARGVIPNGVWNKINNRIFYSVRRYEAWLESLWDCPQGLNSLTVQSRSASIKMGGDIAKRLPIPRRPKGSSQPQLYVLK